MGKKEEALRQEALTLPEADRVDIAGASLNSLKPLEETDVEAAWRQEIAARVAALDAGEVETIPWAELRNRLFVRLRERQAN